MTKRRSKRHSDVSRKGVRIPHPSDTIREKCPTPRKLAFSSEERALDALKYMAHDGRDSRPSRVYECPCGYWHSTRRGEWVD